MKCNVWTSQLSLVLCLGLLLSSCAFELTPPFNNTTTSSSTATNTAAYPFSNLTGAWLGTSTSQVDGGAFATCLVMFEAENHAITGQYYLVDQSNQWVYLGEMTGVIQRTGSGYAVGDININYADGSYTAYNGNFSATNFEGTFSYVSGGQVGNQGTASLVRYDNCS